MPRAILVGGNSALRVTCRPHGFSHAVTGAGFHLAALSTKDEANATFADDPMFDSLSSTFARERALTITSYVIGTAAVSLGIWWLTR